jgi:hypothetical protein
MAKGQLAEVVERRVEQPNLGYGQLLNTSASAENVGQVALLARAVLEQR